MMHCGNLSSKDGNRVATFFFEVAIGLKSYVRVVTLCDKRLSVLWKWPRRIVTILPSGIAIVHSVESFYVSSFNSFFHIPHLPIVKTIVPGLVR